jgi:Fe-S-cluster containining protein
MPDKRNIELPVVDRCDGCGVCCLHMGYPAFMLPREPMSAEQIDQAPECQTMLEQGWTRDELQRGFQGEPHWHSLPADLKQQWLEFARNYRREGDLDGPCCWFDPVTRQCRHHVYRPRVCRDFEIGSRTCREWRSHYQHLIMN